MPSRRLQQAHAAVPLPKNFTGTSMPGLDEYCSEQSGTRIMLDQTLQRELEAIKVFLVDGFQKMDLLREISEQQRVMSQQVAALCDSMGIAQPQGGGHVGQTSCASNNTQNDSLLLSDDSANNDSATCAHKLHGQTGMDTQVRKSQPLETPAWCRLAIQELNHASKIASHGQGMDRRLLHKDSGLFSKIVNSSAFKNITLLVTSLYCLYLGFEIDLGSGDSLFFLLFDAVFKMYFAVEALIRFFSYRSLRHCLKDVGFVFDVVLVVLGVLDILMSFGIQANFLLVVRFQRALWITRLRHVFASVPDVLIIVKGLTVASRSVMLVTVFVLAVLYVCGYLMRQWVIILDTPEIDVYWGSLSKCMQTLLFSFVFYDNLEQVSSTVVGSPGGLLVLFGLLVFMLTTSIMLMNVLIGIIVEIVSLVSTEEKDVMSSRLIKKSFLLQLQKFDDGDDEITKPELDKMILDLESADILRSLDVNVLYLAQMKDLLFENGGSTTISIDCIVEMMMMCRGSQSVTIQQFADGIAFLNHMIAKSEARISGRISEAGVVLQDGRKLHGILDSPSVPA